jgi:hypothetical protein
VHAATHISLTVLDDVVFDDVVFDDVVFLAGFSTTAVLLFLPKRA